MIKSILHEHVKDLSYQEQLFNDVVLPLFESYPELALFSNNQTAATSEGTVSNNDNSWTFFLIQRDLLEKVPQKHIELERTLHSVVCFKLIVDGSELAHQYWVQNQKNAALTYDSFKKLSILATDFTNLPEALKVIEASLVYSDLAKVKEITRRGAEKGLNIEDHDDFMEALYAPDAAELRKEIIPSFEMLPKNIKNIIIDLNTSLPIHWGYFLQLEGGQNMFAKLLNSNKKVSDQLLKLNFLINVSDIAGALAHVDPLGSLTFNQHVWDGFQMVLDAIETYLLKKDPSEAYLYLLQKKANYLCYPLEEAEDEKISILIRLSFFLRLYTQEDGALLKKHSNSIWSEEEWFLVEKCFGVNSGINNWNHHPTYIPAVLLNLFNSTSEIDFKYYRALNGFIVLAKIIDEYERLGYSQEENPLCFNMLASQAKSNPILFEKNHFDISQINWDDPKNLIIIQPKESANYKLKPLSI